MKRINYLLIVLSLLSVMACAGNDKITSDTNILPVSSRQFISDHFKDIPVSHIQIEKNLIRIKRHGLPIPPAIIPEVIQDLIKKNYSSNKVVKIEKEIRDYEIKLDNGLEMTFDLKGNLIDIDD